LKKNVYAVRDLKAASFIFPHFDITHGQAIRGFGDSVRNPKSPFGLHPEDYSLYHIGEFDEEQGILIPIKVPVLLSSATDFPLNAPPTLAAANGKKPEVVHA